VLLEQELEELWGAGLTADDVIVLSLREAEESAATLVRSQPWSDRLEVLDDSNIVEAQGGKLRYSSVRRFKGLEAPIVVLTDVEKLDEKSRALLYVGMTRAIHRLVVLANESVASEIRRAVRVSGGRRGQAARS